MLMNLFEIFAFILYMWPRTSVATSTNLSAPSTWQGMESNMSRISLEDLANQAAATLVSLANPSIDNAYMQWVENHASAFAVLALQDYHSGNVTWADTVSNGMQTFTKQFGLYGGPPRLNSDAIYWGLVAFYAYRTYKQDALLDLAMTAYNATYSNAFISATAAASGIVANRNISFTNCTSRTGPGGAFYVLDSPNDPYVNGETVSPFMTLSAYLYEHTKNPSYAQATQMSLDFILNYMWNGTIILDSFDMLTCTPVVNPLVLLTSDQAWLIEGLSVWANITNNGTLTTLLEGIVSNATTFPVWSLPNGVIDESTGPNNDHVTLKGIFIRALTEAHARNPDTDLARYIETYTMVQFNSILNNARSPANDSFYSMSWFSLPDQSFSATGNTAALDVLNAAFSFTAPTNLSGGIASSSAGPVPTSTTTGERSQHSGRSQAGAITGGVVGGIVFVFAVVVGIVLCRRRRNRIKSSEGIENKLDNSRSENAAVVAPFNLASPDITRPSKWERFYTPHQVQDLISVTTLPLVGNTHARSIPECTALTQDDIHHQDVSLEPDEHLIAEIPTIVRRLNTLWQRRGEMPPAYES